MNLYFAIFAGITLILITTFIIYRFRAKQSGLEFFFNKTPLKLSIVFIVKNNEKLLKNCIKIIKDQKISIYEIVILDLGSIDQTLGAAKELQDIGVKVTISTIKEKTLNENYENITRRFITGDVQFIVDLYKLSIDNPKVMLPEIFKGLKLFNLKKVNIFDRRINIESILNLKKIEKEKNSFLLKKYIMEFISNISMLIDNLKENNNYKTDELEKYLEDIKAYIQKSTANILLLLRIMGNIKFAEKSLSDNIQNIIKEYHNEYNVEIYYEARGTEKQFKNQIGNLILNSMQEILFIIIQGSFASKIQVVSCFGKRNFYMIFKFKSGNNRVGFINTENELGHYMLLSAQNWLSLINGEIKVRTKKDKNTWISLSAPVNSQTCQVEGEKSNEE